MTHVHNQPVSSYRHVEDQQFNKLVQTGNPWIVLVAVTVKYGMAPIMCLGMMFFIWKGTLDFKEYIRTKDQETKAYNEKLLDVVTSSTRVLQDVDSSQKNLCKAIDELRRDSNHRNVRN